MSAYYNEFEPYAAQWLRNLIAAGHIAPGDVDERDIRLVQPEDLRGYRQCHFFAGIGGWSKAIRNAGWADEEPVWTGSCPCQPLSVNGQHKAHVDERHLWPAFYRIIAEFRPAVVFGEQVTSKDGREWFSGVRADMEAIGYACGGADLCAAGFGAPHIRQRLYWVADADKARWSNIARSEASAERTWIRAAGVGCGPCFWGRDGEQTRFADGSARRAKSGIRILVDGFPGRVAAVGAYGNAIVPQVAEEFVRAYMDCAP